MTEIPYAPVKRILKNALPGDYRVGKEAVERTQDKLEEFATEVAVTAVELARHRGVATVQGIDMELALQKVSKKWIIGVGVGD